MNEETNTVVENLETEMVEKAPVNFDDLARQFVIELKKLYQRGGQAVFVLTRPDWEEGLRTKLQEYPEEEYPQIFKDHLNIFGDAEVESIRIITNTELELQFLESYFTGNGKLQKLQNLLQNNTITLNITPTIRQTIPIPVNLTIEFLRTWFLLEQVERLSPKIEKVPFGATIEKVIKGR